MKGKAERAFLEYRRSGRPRAMAAVFDAAAPELLLVAGHLARQAAEAEDLVQMTLLEAMEHRERYDADRPLLPWLLGILVRQHRRELRRRARAIPTDGRAAVEPPDPADEAENAELVQVLSEAIAGLPSAYRDALNLRLVHGLEPAQIGHALGRPLETVRTQLRRGRALLRDALPKSLAGAVAFEPAGLDAARAAVIAHAESLVVAPTLIGASIGATVLMKKALVPLVVLVAGTAWWAARSGPAEVASPRADHVAPDDASLAPSANEVVLNEPGNTESVRVPTETPIESAPAAPEPASVECKVVWEEDGTMAVDLLVRLDVADEGWMAPSHFATTDDNGVARFEGLPLGRATLRGDRGGSTGIWLTPGNNFVELVIPKGILVEGIVLDIEDNPLADAELWVSATGSSANSGAWHGRSGPDGRFRFRGLEPNRLLSARVPGYRAADAAIVEGNPGDRVEVTLRVGAPAPNVRGIVFDDSGQPLEGAAVLVGYAMNEVMRFGGRLQVGPPAHVMHTDERGEFVAYGVHEGWEQPVWVGAEGFAVWRAEVEIETPVTEVVVHLEPEARVHGVAYDQAGAPLDSNALDNNVTVYVRQDGIDPPAGFGYSGPYWGRAEDWVDDNGAFEVERIGAGRVTLQAQHHDGREANEIVDLVAGQSLEWNPTLDSGGTIVGVAVDERGKPLEGLRITASAEVGGSQYLENANTDESGKFILEGAVRSAYLLRVSDPTVDLYNASVVILGVAPGGEPLRVVVPDSKLASGRLTGMLFTPEGVPFEGTWITVRSVGADGQYASGGSNSHLNGGRLRTGLLPPGTYAIAVSNDTYGFWEVGEFELPPGQEIDIGDHTCAAGGTISVEVFDVNREPVPELMIDVNFEGSGQGRQLNIRNGVGKSEILQPGIYWVGTHGYGQPLFSKGVEVLAGETVSVELTLPKTVTRSVQMPAFEIEDVLTTLTFKRDGAVVSRRTSIISTDANSAPHELQFAPGSYEVEVRLGNGNSATTSFEVDDRSESTEIIVLPVPSGG